MLKQIQTGCHCVLSCGTLPFQGKVPLDTTVQGFKAPGTATGHRRTRGLAEDGNIASCSRRGGDKQNVARSLAGAFQLEKDETLTNATVWVGNVVSDSSQSPRPHFIYYRIFIRNVQNRQIHRDVK